MNSVKWSEKGNRVAPGRGKDTTSSDKEQWMLDEARVGLEIQKSCLEEGARTIIWSEFFLPWYFVKQLEDTVDSWLSVGGQQVV